MTASQDDATLMMLRALRIVETRLAGTSGQVSNDEMWRLLNQEVAESGDPARLIGALAAVAGGAVALSASQISQPPSFVLGKLREMLVRDSGL